MRSILNPILLKRHSGDQAKPETPESLRALHDKGDSGQARMTAQKGFTLVELLIYMGLLVILLSVLTSIFVSSLNVQRESEANSAVEQDANYILSKLAFDIHRAQSITIPATLGGTSTTNFQIVVSGINYTYSIDADNNLVLQEGLGANNNLNGYGTSISNLSVTRLGNAGKIEDTLDISFTITGRTRKNTGYETKNFQTNLALRRQ